MGGGVHVCIEASNEPCIHKSASHVACRESARPLALLRSSCENDTQSWDSMQVSAPGCSWDELYFGKDKKNIDCEMLHWAWEGVYRSVLQRVMSLASKNPHQIVRAETAVNAVAMLRSSCGNNT